MIVHHIVAADTNNQVDRVYTVQYCKIKTKNYNYNYVHAVNFLLYFLLGFITFSTITVLRIGSGWECGCLGIELRLL